MAGDGWKKDERRWCDADRTRIQRRFRHHVRTPGNPRGRIRREACAFAGRSDVGKCWSFKVDPSTGQPATDGHHVDYDRPWAVVWLCFTHHRKVDHGSLRFRKVLDVWDYASLIEPQGRPTLRRGAGTAPF